MAVQLLIWLVEKITFSSVNCFGQFWYMEPRSPLGIWLQALSGSGAQVTLPSSVAHSQISLPVESRQMSAAPVHRCSEP